MEDKQNRMLIILGIIAILAILGIVFLLKSAMSAEVVRRYPPAIPPIMYPTSVARLKCELPEARLDLSKEACRRIGWAQCSEIHNTPNRITTCYQTCGQEVANICRKAHGDPLYGVGIRYTYEPRIGLRRPTWAQ